MPAIGFPRLEAAVDAATARLCGASMIVHVQEPILRLLDEDGKEIELPAGCTLLLVNTSILDQVRARNGKNPDS